MPCFHPLRAFRDSEGIRFVGGAEIHNLMLPCGKCDGCLLERARQWSVRIMHEAQMYEFNSFVTLTYDDAHLPFDGGLHHIDFQKFMKRLRKKFGNEIRYFMCGEYGGKLGRPHFHAILFNLTFTDLQLHMTTGSGESLFRSATLEKLWPYGFSSIGSVTIQSAAYVARYTFQKVKNKSNYETVNVETGEIFERRPEYNRMSLGTHDSKGGIGKAWFMKFASDIYPHDRLVIDGTKCKPPRYYDKCFEAINPVKFNSIRNKRMVANSANCRDNTPARLRVKEVVAQAAISKFKRSL